MFWLKLKDKYLIRTKLKYVNFINTNIKRLKVIFFLKRWKAKRLGNIYHLCFFSKRWGVKIRKACTRYFLLWLYFKSPICPRWKAVSSCTLTFFFLHPHNFVNSETDLHNFGIWECVTDSSIQKWIMLHSGWGVFRKQSLHKLLISGLLNLEA